MKKTGADVENLLTFNPFKVFEIKETFEIKNLDEIYYKLYKNSNNKNIINKAYEILKNDIKKIEILCIINGFYKPDFSIASEMFYIINSSTKNDYLKEVEINLFKYAKNANWENSWHWLQKYNYLSKKQ